MLRKLGYFVLALGLTLPAWPADRPSSLSGYVRDPRGVPQMGAAVKVLGSAMGTFTVFTDDKGFFSATGMQPGIYSLKISATSFLPTLREKVDVKAGANVLLDLTLSTLFDAIQFAPRRGNAEDGDWDWVLRSTANRPILRAIPGTAPVSAARNEPLSDLKGTLSFVAGAPSQGFGSVSEMSTGFVVEKSIFSTGRLTVNGDVGYGTGVPNGVMRTSYKRQMPNGSTPEVAFTMRRFASPDLGIRGGGLQSLALMTSDDLNLGDVLELKFGSELQTVQFLGRVTAFRPFGSVAAHLSSDTVVEYRYATSRPDSRSEKGFESAPADLSESNPRMSIAGFAPALEKAQHHEVALSHRSGKTNMQVAVYADRLTNPALTGVGEFSALNAQVLPDLSSGTFTYQGRDLETRGMRLVLERKLAADVTATLDYGYGGALALNQDRVNLADLQEHSVVSNHHSAAVKLSGTAPATKTRWIASYGWTGGRALTPVDIFNASAGQIDPFLALFLRQPVPGTGSLPGHMDMLLEVRNLLAQGYVPVIGQDGRTVYLVQSARAVRGGVEFSF